ncbi:hypothetical protein Y032_0505g2671 [Ancylostoma ceylanicum]|uniref:SCP domain-containing protein n=1 Tax=Ancylostoma ceylanicum TaxID=53326 RepID=A0A016WU24_9BILA|nr:hypothetical protein Y032_0505g2671 [Ancylostoma ceylanicum]
MEGIWPDPHPAIETDKALPKADCTDDGMTLDMQNTAKYMHNYYRKVIASGWAKDKNGYAPRAKNMNELKYDCANMGADTLGTIDCAKHQYTAKGGNSLNYKEYSWEVTPADALQKAISEWYGELENVDLDEQSTYNQQIKTNANKFANMAVAEATKFACAAKQCKAQGHTVAVCQYNYPPDDDTPLYEVGKPCAGCDKATTTCDQMILHSALDEGRW